MARSSFLGSFLPFHQNHQAFSGQSRAQRLGKKAIRMPKIDLIVFKKIDVGEKRTVVKNSDSVSS